MSNLTPPPPSTTLTIDRPSRGLELLDLDGLTFLFQDLEVKERRGDCGRSPGETPVPRHTPPLQTIIIIITIITIIITRH
ncbi:hypothetical protein E2C01_022625 [Portunus trituberculatus]|uniref:Uncharacterized protein n=1 Tax=Portunus trituberculatus TaxID=210409 RepID=A0A5B7E7T4_PORTR|nr:hypothetical protein [Portunus trituberculatus]